MKEQPLTEVEAYMRALSRVHEAVQISYPESRALACILRLYRSRALGKDGFIHEDIGYHIHGSGCLFVEANGAEVDVDFLDEGVAIFDAWRVRRFSVSIGEELPGGLDGISAECRNLVLRGRLVEPCGGWFSVVE
ncbi:DUF6896 domain-containing protein [Streptomyces sp. NPDC001780]